MLIFENIFIVIVDVFGLGLQLLVSVKSGSSFQKLAVQIGPGRVGQLGPARKINSMIMV